MQTAEAIDMDEEQIGLQEAAKIVGVCPEQLRMMASRGELPAVKLRTWRFYASELKLWLREKMRENQKQGGGETCLSTGRKTKTAQKLPMSTSPSRAASECEKALGLKRPSKMRKGSLRSIMTNADMNYGDKPSSETSLGAPGMRQS
nr:helix-turn-helix domain-containing protein [Mariprofundus ferrooxydans]